MGGKPLYPSVCCCLATLLIAVVSVHAAGPNESVSKSDTHQATPVCTYNEIARYPHDSEAFTQGLVYTDGVLYEGTGLYGESTLRRVTLETGVLEQVYDLPAGYFGEGVTTRGAELIQLTWQGQVGFVYVDDGEDFIKVGEFNYPGQGWGLTFDGDWLIMSDGTSSLRFLDPLTFAEVSRLEVRDDGVLVNKLNELEYIHGEIFANIWYSNRIARIDPTSGDLIAWVDLTGILDPPVPGVLNGIAYDKLTNHLLVTGKDWPLLFEIELVDCPPYLPFFADGFESGDVQGWSSYFPP
ncbi:MAG: glutaminyl-peptide cyclotransferase [bacterium]|nr:glutaminyl-peptide cyclotransferase [bacterium]